MRSSWFRGDGEHFRSSRIGFLRLPALIVAGALLAATLVPTLTAMATPAAAASSVAESPRQLADAPPAAAAADPTGCSYASGSPGKYSNTICWIDFSGYDDAAAASPAGQYMELQLDGGFTASFTLQKRAVPGWPLKPLGAFSTYDMQAHLAGYQGSFSNDWYGTAQGRPVLWNIYGMNSGFALTLSDIKVTGPDGNPITAYRFVTGDAESTNAQETVTFSSDKPLTFLEQLKNANSTMGCYQGLNVTGNGTTSVTCTGVNGTTAGTADSTAGNVLYAADSPRSITQTVTSTTANAGVFGFMMARAELTKEVVSRSAATDSFTIDIASGGSTLRSATTGSSSGAGTGLVTVLAGSALDLRETADGATRLEDYNATWACEINGEPSPIVPSAGSTSLYLAPGAFAPGDLVSCRISNEAIPRELSLTKTSDASPDSRPGDTVIYTVTATNTGTVDYTDENPAVVLDELTGVLDDASLDETSLASDRGDAPTYLAPLLSWKGALAAGQSVSLTYAVTLKAGGDGSVRNVAWRPIDPTEPDPKAPQCDLDSGSGVDPVTAEPCGFTEFLLPKLTIKKTSNVFDLPVDGGVVTYEITVTNAGPGDTSEEAPATFDDDLSDVLDDASFVEGSLLTSTGAANRDGNTLNWTGALAAGQSATVSYQVAYDSNAGGTKQLVNLACVPEDLARSLDDTCRSVVIPGAALKQWKRVQSSDTPAVAGSVLSYTLFFENNGQTAADVDAVDELSQVIDDADVTTEPSSVDGLTATRNGDRIAITGSIPPGERYSVTYQVTVKADGERGDDTASNFLLKNGEEPGPGGSCEPAEGALPDCTVTPIAAVTYEKTVEASTDPVGEGTVLSYTITVRNTGAAAVPVAREDVLTDVLDDADLTADPESDTASVTVTGVTDGRFALGGELAVGRTAKISYEVTVKPQNERGNNAANNFLVPNGGEPDPECQAGRTDCTTTGLPKIEASKASDPASGSEVAAGQEISYTLTFRNTGAAAGGVAYTDDLSGVLDDAALVAAPAASDDALSASLGSSGRLAVAGSLEVGQTVTVSYTVRVLADGQRGDHRLANMLLPNGTTDPDCQTVGVSCTEHLIGELDDWKTVDPVSGSTVAAGQAVSYTLHFANTGKAAVAVDREDVLTDVLDDAAVTSDPAASTDALTVSTIVDGRFSVSGSLEPGEHVTVSYTVTIGENGERGDDRLANYLVPSGGEPPAECDPVDADRADCTVNHVSDVAVVKSSDPKSGADVKPGQEITYTLTFTNRSKDADAAPAVVDYTDHMADVLDDAELTEGPAASDRALRATAAGDEIRIFGSLTPGQTVTVSYTVTVKAYGEQGDHALDNVVAVTGEAPVCAAGSQLCTHHDALKSVPGLARTGAALTEVGILSSLLLLLGGGALAIESRRRRLRAEVRTGDRRE